MHPTALLDTGHWPPKKDKRRLEHRPHLPSVNIRSKVSKEIAWTMMDLLKTGIIDRILSWQLQHFGYLHDHYSFGMANESQCLKQQIWANFRDATCCLFR